MARKKNKRSKGASLENTKQENTKQEKAKQENTKQDKLESVAQLTPEDSQGNDVERAQSGKGVEAEGQAPERAHGNDPEGVGNPERDFRSWALYLLALVLLVGMWLAIHLTRVHLDILYGEGTLSALCDYSSGFSCSDVVGSEYSKLFGVIPLSVLAIPVYWLMIFLTLAGLRGRNRGSLGLVELLAIGANIFTLYLIYVSKFKIGSFCPFCAGMYVVGFLALFLPAVGARASFGSLLQLGLDEATSKRGMVLALANLLVVSGIAFGSYAVVKGQMVEEATQRALAGSTPAKQASATKDKQASATKDKQASATKDKQASATKDKQASATKGKRGTSKTAESPRHRPGGRVDERFDVPLDDSVATKGPRDAPVTIVVYEDFQCGFCKRLSSNLGVLLKRYPERVKLAFRHFPMNTSCNDAGIARSMHPDACRGAIASECARQQDKFWPYYELLFKNFGNLSPSDVHSFANEVGLDMTRFNQCAKDAATVEKIRADSRTGGALGISGTPTFFVNGRKFAGAQSIEVLSALVEAEAKGETLSRIELRDVEKTEDITGTVKSPEMVTLTGPNGPFEMDAVEASIVGGKATARAGIEATTGVTWFDANAACEAAGKRLCTEAEWVTACRGEVPIDSNHNSNYTDDHVVGHTYPYGDFYQPGYCNDQVEPPRLPKGQTPPPPPPPITGNHPKCKSKDGVYDLSGNVREWVGTVPHVAAYIGGAFASKDSATCSSRVQSVGPYHEGDTIGFRCCRGGVVDEKVTHPGRQVGQVLTEFRGTTVDGKAFTSNSFKGKVTLVTFWASWCNVCRRELPAFSSVYPDLHKKGFEMVGINVDHDARKAQTFLKKHPLTFPSILDTDNSILQSFDTVGMPTSYLINKKGEIVQRKRGYDKGDEKRLEHTVLEMIEE